MSYAWVPAFLAALLLLYAASCWLRLSRRIDRRKVDELPVVPVLDLQGAAQASALALGALAVAIILGWAIWHGI
jgi:hypothetical protein